MFRHVFEIEKDGFDDNNLDHYSNILDRSVENRKF